MNKRTTKDLVDDLTQAARDDNVLRAGLVVGFQDRTEMVWASDPHPVQTLNGLLREGGMPLGMARFATGGLEVTTLPEHEGVEWAEQYLASIAGTIMEGLAQHLGVAYPHPAPAPDQGSEARH